MVDVKRLELVARPIEAVQYTGDNYVEVKDWVQGYLTFAQVTATAERLYLPGIDGVEVLEPSSWVFRDPESNTFRGATDDAVKQFYIVLPNDPETTQE